MNSVETGLVAVPGTQTITYTNKLTPDPKHQMRQLRLVESSQALAFALLAFVEMTKAVDIRLPNSWVWMKN